MTKQERIEDTMQKLDFAIGYISKAIEQLEDADRMGLVDVTSIMDRLMEIGGDLELELDCIEDEEELSDD